MKSLVATVSTAALTLLSLFPAQAAAALKPADETYLTTAMQSQLGRYAMATLAQKQASSPQVKALAKSIAAQSSKDTQTLDAIAKQNGVDPAKHPSVRASYHYSQLSDLHGSEFDSRFISELRIDDDISAGNDQTEAKSGSDAALRSFAKQHGSMLQHEMKSLDGIHH